MYSSSTFESAKRKNVRGPNVSDQDAQGSVGSTVGAKYVGSGLESVTPLLPSAVGGRVGGGLLGNFSFPNAAGEG